MMGANPRPSASDVNKEMNQEMIRRGHFTQPASQATVLGRSEKVDIASAALLNGITSHTFDFDDTHLKTIIHPAGPVASAAAPGSRQRTPCAVSHAVAARPGRAARRPGTGRRPGTSSSRTSPSRHHRQADEGVAPFHPG
jgi:2-methylcitrate dehydratase PrpD